ncbi:pectate lyase [Trifolium repens]|nr:pectate lyase [Trifolium repens]
MELWFPSWVVFNILIIALLFTPTNGIHHKENHKSTESRIVNEEDKLKMQNLKNSTMAERNQLGKSLVRIIVLWLL